MKIQYDRQVDALYIELSETSPHRNVEVDDAQGVSIDVDEQGHIVGIEVLDASAILGDGLAQLTVENLLSDPLPAA